MRRRGRPVGILTILALTIIPLMLVVPPAQGHAALILSSPREGESLAVAPGAVQLTFSDAVPVEFADVALTVDDEDARPLTVTSVSSTTLAASLKDEATRAGTWRVAYRVTSADGHPIQGAVTFTVTPAAVLSPSEPAPSVAEPTTTTTTEAPTEDPDADSRSTHPVAVIGGLVLIAIGVAIAARARRRRRDSS